MKIIAIHFKTFFQVLSLNDWLFINGPVGSGIDASDSLWEEVEDVHEKLDEYNNGELCAHSRDSLE